MRRTPSAPAVLCARGATAAPAFQGCPVPVRLCPCNAHPSALSTTLLHSMGLETLMRATPAAARKSCRPVEHNSESPHDPSARAARSVRGEPLTGLRTANGVARVIRGPVELDEGAVPTGAELVPHDGRQLSASVERRATIAAAASVGRPVGLSRGTSPRPGPDTSRPRDRHTRYTCSHVRRIAALTGTAFQAVLRCGRYHRASSARWRPRGRRAGLQRGR